MRRPPKPRGKVAEDAAGDLEAIRRAAQGHLARRDFPSTELVQKLSAQGYAADAARVVVAGLAEERLLDDARYAANFVAFHAGRGQGPMRIRQELGAVGLPGDLIAEAMESGPDFAAVCRQVRARKFGASVPSVWKDKARQMRFLQYRGFSSDHIRSAFGPDFDPEE